MVDIMTGTGVNDSGNFRERFEGAIATIWEGPSSPAEPQCFCNFVKKPFLFLYFWLTDGFCNSYKLHTIRDFNWWWELIPEGGFQATMYKYDMRRSQ
jgi:hypothetical protein